MIRKLVNPFYSAAGSRPLSPGNLRKMTDHDLCKFLQTHYDLSFADPFLFHKMLSNLHPEAYYCESEAEISEWRKGVENHPNLVFVGTEKLPGFDAGTAYNVVDPETGKIAKFREVDEFEAGIIERLAETTNPLVVYYYDAQEDTPLNRIVREVFIA